MLTDTAHFDTHQPVENVTFVGCVAIGGVPAISEAYGFQMRGRNCSIIGCTVLQAIGRGIMLFGPVSSGASIVATDRKCKSDWEHSWDGDLLRRTRNARRAATSNHTVTGNVIKNCEGSAIANGGLNSDIVISGTR
jgi:hypothetical protein